MPRFEQFAARCRLLRELALIGSGYLAHKILGFQDNRKLVGFMMVAEGLITDGGVKKSGETESFVVADRFQVAPQRLRANVDAKDCLGLGPDFALVCLIRLRQNCVRRFRA